MNPLTGRSSRLSDATEADMRDRSGPQFGALLVRCRPCRLWTGCSSESNGRVGAPPRAMVSGQRRHVGAAQMSCVMGVAPARARYFPHRLGLYKGKRQRCFFRFPR
jgi:hypothetical protein